MLQIPLEKYLMLTTSVAWHNRDNQHKASVCSCWRWVFLYMYVRAILTILIVVDSRSFVTLHLPPLPTIHIYIIVSLQLSRGSLRVPTNYHHTLPHHTSLLLCSLHHPPLFLNSICRYLPTFSLDPLSIYTFHLLLSLPIQVFEIPWNDQTDWLHKFKLCQDFTNHQASTHSFDELWPEACRSVQLPLALHITVMYVNVHSNELLWESILFLLL